MTIPFRYTFKNFRSRKLTTWITITGIAMVVFVFTAVLMMAYGVQKTLVGTGSDDNVLVSRKAATSEITSIIPNDINQIIRTLPKIKVNAKNEPILSAEPVIVVNIEKVGGGISNVTVRGVSEQVRELRPQIKVAAGRWFNYGSRELVVGRSLAKRFMGSGIGDKIKFAGDFWTIVGVTESEGSGFESEFWGDAIQILSAFNREGSSSTVTLKLASKEDFESFKRAFEAESRLKEFEVKVENKFFEAQSEFMSTFIRILGIFITVIFSLGAIIGATITMYAAVANRTREIGTLRALGFRRSSVMFAFLFESVIISLAGGIIGLTLAAFLQFFSISTLNFNSFSELEFKFAINQSIVITSLVFALIMGFVGGFLPSFRAARLHIIESLRNS